jgi:hypothetical protein
LHHPLCFTRTFFTKNNAAVVPTHPTWLTWLSTTFFCFPNLRHRHFDTTEVIEVKLQVVLNTLTKHYFQETF